MVWLCHHIEISVAFRLVHIKHFPCPILLFQAMKHHPIRPNSPSRCLFHKIFNYFSFSTWDSL